MKKKLSLLAVLTIVTLTANCEPAAPSSGTNAPAGGTNASASTAGQHWQNVKSDITNAWQNVKQTTTQAWVAVKTDTTQTWGRIRNSMQSAKDYTYDKKDEFMVNARTEVAALDEKIKGFSAKAANTTDSTKTDAQAKLKTLREKRVILDKKLDDVKNATQSGWDDAKTAFKNSYDDTKNSVKQAWQWLNDKVKS